MARRFAYRSSSMKKIWSEFTTTKLNVSRGTRHHSKAADSSLKLLKSFRVAPPTTPLLDQWMHLSNLDTVVPPHYVPAFLIYKKETLQNVSFDAIISTLQTSLQRALVPFYPFSGRLKQDDKSTWHVHLNNQGAQFNIVETELELQEIQYYMPGPEQDMLAPPSSVTCGQGVSPVHIQVTRFKCGAVAVCCSVHHHLADAQGMSLFVKSWADFARNSGGSAKAPAITHDRTPLLGLTPPPTSAATPPIFSRKDAPTNINPHQKTEAFFIDSSFIARARQESSLSATTTFEAITSFFWQQILRAQQDTGLLSGALATMCLMVNGRKQLGLPVDFVGNASVPVRATGPVKELLQQPLSYGAERIRMGVKEVDRQYIMSVIEHCQSSGGNACYIRDDVVATSAARLPVYDVDFGWGKPTFSGFQMPAPGALEGGLLYTPAPAGADGAVAFVQLDHRVLDSLIKNERMEQMAFYYKQMFTHKAGDK